MSSNTVQGNLKNAAGKKVIPNTTTGAVYDAAKDQALSATLRDTPDKTTLGYPSFTTTDDYATGQVVYYNNRLWKFTADHSAGAWDAEEVESFDIKTLLDEIIASMENGDFGKILGEAFASLNGRIATLEAALRDERQRIDLTVENLDASNITRFKAPLVLECSTAGAPSAANVPDNWDQETMGIWAGYPVFAGQVYIDKTSKKIYIAYTVTASTANWVALN